MLKKHVIICCLCFVCISSLAFDFKSAAVIEKNETPNPTDTTSFAPNSVDGWSILSCYINQNSPDSVQFELLLKQTNSIDWYSEQFIGTITNAAFTPQQSQQNLDFYLMFNNTWKVRILPNGKCFFKLKDGLPPPGIPIVLPFKVRYKNN